MRAFLIACLAAALLPWFTRPTGAKTSAVASRDWPDPFRRMQAGELSDTERRLAAGDRLARFHQDGRDWLVRWIGDASRRVHPAEECYRGTGWRVRPRPAQVSVGGEAGLPGRQLRWGCFEALRGREDVEVCQTITDDAGRSWSDPGSWWWAATFGQTTGPWLGVVKVTAMPPLR